MIRRPAILVCSAWLWSMPACVVSETVAGDASSTPDFSPLPDATGDHTPPVDPDYGPPPDESGPDGSPLACEPYGTGTEQCAADEVCPGLTSECYPVAGWPGSECDPSKTFSVQFDSADIPWTQGSEWDTAFAATVVSTADNELVLATDTETVTIRYDIGQYEMPVVPGQHVFVTFRRAMIFGVATGLKLQAPDTTLLFLGDDGQFGPAWGANGPEDDSLQWFSVQPELAGCPVHDDVFDGCAVSVPVALRFGHESGGSALVLPGEQGVLGVQTGVWAYLVNGYTVVNADANTLADVQCTDMADVRAYLILADELVAGMIPGEMLYPCSGASDCDSGFCVGWPGGQGVCTAYCTVTCPPSWACRSQATGPEPFFLCHPDPSAAAMTPRDGGFAEPCLANVNCASGLCIQDQGGSFVCTRLCADDCPPGWHCVGVPWNEPDIAYMCVPAPAAPGEFGSPCTDGADCNSGWCVDSPAGQVCTQTCIVDCPGDWVCQAVEDTPPDVVYLCMPPP